jgi:hypothetical protein
VWDLNAGDLLRLAGRSLASTASPGAANFPARRLPVYDKIRYRPMPFEQQLRSRADTLNGNSQPVDAGHRWRGDGGGAEPRAGQA